MKKCNRCGLEISSEQIVRKQWYEWLDTKDSIANIGDEFIYNCIQCHAPITIKFELQPFFYLEET